MRNNHSLQLIRNGKPALGLWLTSGSYITTRYLAMQGCMDWLMIDGEHTALDLSTMSLLASTIADASQGKCTPFIRVAAGTVDQIKQALDAGAQGVLVPMVNTAQEARDIVSFSRYPPEGVRGNGGTVPHLSYAMTRGEYTKHANREVAVAIQVETQEAVNNIDDIVAVKGLDMVFIGPNDLHISYGYDPSYWSDAPSFQTAVQKVLSACKRANMPCGILMGSAAQVKARIAEGFTFVGFGGDTAYLLGAVGAAFGHATGTPDPAGGWGGYIRKDIV
jgi:4-hydroxy-2-oxoheptanedioate aldolase